MAVCPVCMSAWGCAWPPVSVCPVCLTPENLRRLRNGELLSRTAQALIKQEAKAPQ